MTLSQILSRLARSTFFISAISIASVFIFVTVVLPKLTAVTYKPHGYKVLQFLPSGDNPDIVLLGSSFVLTPSTRCEDKVQGERPRFDGWFYTVHSAENSKASFLENLIRSRTGHSVHVINLALNGNMVSDDLLILSKTLEWGKHPKLIICGITPRDFIDNTWTGPEETGTCKSLSGFSPEKSAPPPWCWVFAANKTAINSVTLFKNTLGGWRLAFMSSAFRISKIVIDQDKTAVLAQTIRPQTNNMAAVPKAAMTSIDNRKKNSRQRTQASTLWGDTPDYTPKQNTFKDLDYYKDRFNPPVPGLFEKQAIALEKFLALARKSKVDVLLVNMPITERHKQLLPYFVHQKYAPLLISLTTKYGVPFLNLDQSMTTDTNDFEDSCHLNERGGEKFFAALMNELLGNHKFSAIASQQ